MVPYALSTRVIWNCYNEASTFRMRLARLKTEVNGSNGTIMSRVPEGRCRHTSSAPHRVMRGFR
jgi:hypothetical protein